jgi:hypothetical protein
MPSIPYSLSENTAVGYLQKALMREWDDAQEAFDKVGDSPIQSQLSALVKTLSEQAFYLVSADLKSGLYGLHHHVLPLMSLIEDVQKLLEKPYMAQAIGASHLVGAAHLESGMNIHLLGAFCIENSEEGNISLYPPTGLIDGEGYTRPGMKAAADVLVKLGKVRPELADLLPDVSPCGVLGCGEEE